ncbi:MAG: DUF4358 domain-containing protein [Clostridiales bacterium]|nr:DUF4358 domain-containing protein [Clostridiales bacterium]
MMKRCISALMLLTLCLTLCECAEKEKMLAVSVCELSDKVADSMASEQTAEYDETMLLDELGIQSSMFTEGFYKIGASDASVEEVAFFKAADEDSALQLKQKLETRKAATEATQKDYNADNYAVATAATVETEGLYVYMVMSANRDAVTKAIEDNLK